MLRIRHLGLVCSLFLILGASTAMAQVDCTGVPQWELPTIYDIGDRVVFEGRLYECIVPSQIVTPPSDPVRWRDLGACSGGGGGSQGVRIVGSWVAGATHARESGSNRLLVFTAHVEHSAAITLNSVTYGGRSMAKIIERSATSAGSAFVAYTAVFTLNESGIAAASNGTFTTAFSATPERPPAFSSVFLVNVNQASPAGASASAVSTGATATTAGLATASGDLVILAASNGNTGSYTVNNGFTEAIELTITSADGVAGSKPATGATETPSVTHSAPIRQSLIGLVIRGGAGGGNLPPTFTNDPFTKPSATVGQAYNSSIAGDATDPNGDPLTFSKVNGPAWLSVAGNGALSGTPASANQGLNTFTVSASDGRGGSDMATMNITVVAAANSPPAFVLDPFSKPNATVGLAYSSSIAGDATDPNSDPLTFSKVNGPAWLSVASNGALSGTPAVANQGLNMFTVSVSDGRGGSDTATMNITVQPQQQGCNIPRHILIGYWANFPNSGQFFPLRQVSSNYNVVNIAFGLPRSPTDPTIQFEVPTQFYPTNQDFANDVATLQGQGRKVVLSIGGAAGGAFELNTDAERNTFVNSVFNLITTFGFDGIDVDFEGGGPGNPLLRNANDNDFRNPTTPRIRNAILALREIRNRFVNAFPNRCFILSFAPETFFLQAGFQFYASSVPTTLGCYIPVIDALRDITSWVHTQDYNTGTMLALDQNVYGSGNADFHVAMTEMLLRGFQVGSRDPGPGAVFASLREDQVAFGLPASTAAAGSGFTSVQAVQNAVRYLTQRTEYAGRSYTLQKPTGAYPNFRGLMTWNVFHDAANNFEFSANHGPFLRNLP